MRAPRTLAVPALALGTALAMGLTSAGPATAATAGSAAGSASTASSAPAAVQAVPGLESTVEGTWQGRGGQGTVTGTFTPEKFVARGDSLAVRGVLDLQMLDAAGEVVHTASRQVNQTVSVTPAGSVSPSVAPAATGFYALPAQAQGCDILNLDLGPLNLNVLGLVVNLEQVVLDIIAVPGAGNLLGNLLCAVAGLLDGVGFLGLVADLLNAILAILQELAGTGAAAAPAVATTSV